MLYDGLLLNAAKVREYVRSSLWFIPGACTVAAVGLAMILVNVDRHIPQRRRAWYLFGGSGEAAKTLLATTSSSMLTFTALVFSITIVVLQLASGQFSPRVQRTFLRDRVSKLTLGVFIATFTYSVLLLRVVRLSNETGVEFVPALSVTVSIGLVMLSIAFFVRYIDHIAQAIRAGSIIRSVAAETFHAMDSLYPDGLGKAAPLPSADLPHRDPDALVASKGSGVVTGVDADRLFSVAKRFELTIEVVPLVGDFVPSGGTLARIWGADSDEAQGKIRAAVLLAGERTMNQDVAYGFRQLVDIAERALSPGINDPTTAVQVLDALHDLLRRLIDKDLPSTIRTDDDERACIIAPAPSWEQFLSLALDEIRLYGAGSIQIVRRMRALLRDLAEVAPSARGDSIQQQLRRLDAAADREIEDPDDRREAEKPSGQGNL